MPTPQTQPIHLLLVDDSRLNLNILTEFLREKNYALTTASDGAEAWALLEGEPDRFHSVLLDRVMPEMDGMEVLRRMKDHDVLSHIPVIMQTAAAAPKQTQEGLQAGAYYYLAKPFEKAVLLAIVEAAVRDRVNFLAVRGDLHRTNATIGLLDSATFTFRTPDEAKHLAMLLAHAYPDPARVATGILELTLNAVEHGNLNIGYAEKTRLLEHNNLDKEIARRLAHPRYASRRATAHFARQSGRISLQITDEGKGFDWQKYLEFDPKRAYDSHGRGIAMANKVSFDQIKYRGTGNRVVAVLQLNKNPKIVAA